MGPLVEVLSLVDKDNEKKPDVRHVYEAMDHVKEAIQKTFDGDERMSFVIIDERWEDQLHQPLHHAMDFLNPAIFYDNLRVKFEEEVNKDLFDCIEKLIPSPQMQDKIVVDCPSTKGLRTYLVIQWLLDRGR